MWQELEARASPNFFLSWTWVSTWLNSYRPDVRIAEIRANDQCVGLGLVTIRTEVRHGFLRSRVLRLGQTGNPAEDQIWIEYNDLLLDSAHCESAPHAFVEFLLQQDDWDEFQLGASMHSRLVCYQNARLSPVLKWSAPSYGVNLSASRALGATYLQRLSRNTRHQITRSERLYKETGDLKFNVHKSADAMLAEWDNLAGMHIARWGGGQGQSGFANPAFATFHRALISNAAGLRQAEFCTLRHGDQLIGCLYNFLYRGRVYFYLSGLAYDDDSRLKPGLLIHALAIEQYKDRGFDYYDFLGGEARYKQSLGLKHCELQLVSFQRARFTLRLEQAGRIIKTNIGHMWGKRH